MTEIIIEIHTYILYVVVWNARAKSYFSMLSQSLTVFLEV